MIVYCEQLELTSGRDQTLVALLTPKAAITSNIKESSFLHADLRIKSLLLIPIQKWRHYVCLEASSPDKHSGQWNADRRDSCLKFNEWRLGRHIITTTSSSMYEHHHMTRRRRIEDERCVHCHCQASTTLETEGRRMQQQLVLASSAERKEYEEGGGREEDPSVRVKERIIVQENGLREPPGKRQTWRQLK